MRSPCRPVFNFLNKEVGENSELAHFSELFLPLVSETDESYKFQKVVVKLN